MRLTRFLSGVTIQGGKGYLSRVDFEKAVMLVGKTKVINKMNSLTEIREQSWKSKSTRRPKNAQSSTPKQWRTLICITSKSSRSMRNWDRIGVYQQIFLSNQIRWEVLEKCCVSLSTMVAASQRNWFSSCSTSRYQIYASRPPGLLHDGILVRVFSFTLRTGKRQQPNFLVAWRKLRTSFTRR